MPIARKKNARNKAFNFSVFQYRARKNPDRIRNRV